MKNIKLIIAAILITFVSVVQAQKQITINDVYKGKPVLQTAKEYDVNAFLETKAIYKVGMSESAFVDLCLKGFPTNFKTLKDVYVPYAKYLYSFHKRGLTENQVLNEVNGVEFVDCVNGCIAWQLANPGVDPPAFSWWRTVIHWAALFFTWLDENLPN